MKVIAPYLIAGVMLLPAGSGLARTCDELAAACARNGGGQYCYEQSRLAECRRTHQYHAPSGRVWSATATSGTSCEEHSAACLRKGGSAEQCSSPARLAACHKTGTWIGPSGKHYKAAR